MFDIRSKFSDDFVFGVATAAYQIEGSKFGGCGESIWDHFAKNGGTANGDNGSLACDHFHRFEEDLDLLVDAGFDAYRFSFSWSRLFPDGKNLNTNGLDFYKQLLDAINSRGLRPYGTAYHWDMPQALGALGGWTIRDNAERFGEYMGFIARNFGDDLENLVSINEPWCVAWLSHYLGEHAPGLRDLSSAVKASHYVCLGHGLGVQAARAETEKPIGVVLNFTPGRLETKTKINTEALERYEAVTNTWYLSAIIKGNYPDVALQELEGYLPNSWKSDLQNIKEPIDFIGINYYTTVLLKSGGDKFPFVEIIERDLPKTDMGWDVEPAGLREAINLVSDYAPNLPLYITENGMASKNAIADIDRIEYYKQHLNEVAKASETLPVNGYFAWSLLDNFEWALGYDKRFGLVHVDYETQKRTMKDSFKWWQRELAKK
ncbi:GH1 family beta-glucosidase [Paracoccaceae bacterium]|nr:GH1 family beta-glucosidase [Paracoccaceae bacterium]